MSEVRRWMVYGLLVGLVGGHGVDVLTHRESWPFSRWTLYSKVYHPKPYTIYWPRGVVTTSAGLREVTLTAADFGPYDTVRLRRAMDQTYSHRPPDLPIGNDYNTRRLYKLYENLRKDRDAQGPPLVGLRVYRMRWKFKWDVSNADGPPDSSTLIAQYVRPRDRPKTPAMAQDGSR